MALFREFLCRELNICESLGAAYLLTEIRFSEISDHYCYYCLLSKKKQKQKTRSAFKLLQML